jgi:fibronectin type 3 domain-containing protein
LAPARPDEELVKRGEHIKSIPSSKLTEYLQGEFIVVQDTLDFPDRSSIYSHSYRYAVIFVNQKNQAAGFSNQILISPVAIPLPPSEISATVEENIIRLKWHEPSENSDGSKPPRIAGYKIYRAEGSGEFKQIHADITQGSIFDDRDFHYDMSYRYAIGTVGSIQNPYAESRPSKVLAVEPRDAFAPAPPENFQAIQQEGSLILLWTPSKSDDVAGYRIYRQDKISGARTLIQKELITVLNYRDSPQEGQYSYAILAVDKHGNESSPVQAGVEMR